MNDARTLWNRYRKYLSVSPAIGLWLDISRMRFDDGLFERMAGPLWQAFDEMDGLERGDIANPDEQRMVGHYWLRDPARAPSAEIQTAITSTLSKIKDFAAQVHTGALRPPSAEAFRELLVVGIGGSALGPQLVASALTSPRDRMRVHFFDNTDPDGFDRTLAAVGDRLKETLVLVISKSGGTKETYNGMVEAREAFRRAGLPFERHFVAVTGEGSQLDQLAKAQGWITTFPMWDWVGGRTSEFSAVGLLPAALQGFDIDAMLAGARAADAVTRQHDLFGNPAALLALMWHFAGEGRGKKDMVVLPYKDRLELFSRYLQQLVMESLGKERDRKGEIVHQGIAVYGNKGSTDQHAYVQQLREGVNNFFVTFIEVLEERKGVKLEVEPGLTAGDYLEGFFLGTRKALYDNERDSMTLTLRELNPSSLAALIAVFERAVGLYASLIHINAYHQPGVEAGKKAAAAVLALQTKVVAALRAAPPEGLDVEALAARAGAPDEVETVFKIVEHLAANPDRGVTKTQGDNVFAAKYLARSL